MNREAIVHALVMATLMSLFMSAVVTLVNTGLDAGFIQRWLRAFMIACPLAFVALMVFRPLAGKIIQVLTRG